jgi:ribosome-associated translation inhibitor RaiA
MCKVKRIKPKYIHFNTKNRTVRDRLTIDNAVAFRINQEIKFLFCKKQNLNNQLLQLHLQAASLFNKKCDSYQAISYHTCICNSAWQWILLSIEEKQSKILNDIYRRLNQKLDSLTQEIHKHKEKIHKHFMNGRVINLSRTQFNNEQLHVLSLGPNYAITRKPHNFINELIMDTESAIRKLDIKIQNPRTDTLLP